MFKVTYTFTDFNGKVHEDVPFYFNLNRSDFAALDAALPGGFDEFVKLTRADGREETLQDSMTLVRDVVKIAFGVKSPDGIHFIKDTPETNNFIYHPAYEMLLADFIKQPAYFIEFFSGAVTEDLRSLIDMDDVQADIRHALDNGLSMEDIVDKYKNRVAGNQGQSVTPVASSPENLDAALTPPPLPSDMNLFKDPMIPPPDAVTGNIINQANLNNPAPE